MSIEDHLVNVHLLPLHIDANRLYINGDSKSISAFTNKDRYIHFPFFDGGAHYCIPFEPLSFSSREDYSSSFLSGVSFPLISLLPIHHLQLL